MTWLTEHTGMWAGTNRFRLMPEDAPAEGGATAHLSLGAAGNVAVLAYTWFHPVDGDQDGVLVLGPADESDELLALWGDSWHQKPAVTQLRGAVDQDSVTVAYSYAEGWEWRITLTTDRPDLLRWRMDNVVPPSASGTDEAVAYWAMDGELRRQG